MLNLAKRLLFLPLLAAALGCPSKPSPWPVARIQLVESTLVGNAALPLSPAELRVELTRALEGQKRFVVLPEKPPEKNKVKGLTCKLEVAFTRESQDDTDTAALRAEVGVVIELKRPGAPERYEATGFGKSYFPPDKPEEKAQAFRRALQQALAQSVESQALQLAALEKKDPELLEDLKSTDPRVRDYSVRALAERKSATAVPALIERLTDTDREVALHAVGALGAIGDARAVPALIEMTKNQEPEFLRTVVEVIATIGGEDAEGFLFTIASGHQDDSVRAAAEEAQQRMHERALESKASTQPPGPVRRSKR